jgi:diphthine methyl ester synthase
LVFFTDTWKPDSFYDRIKENVDLGMHTLVLLDIKVKEQSEENLARSYLIHLLPLWHASLTDLSRGRKIYEPPRYMSVPQAVSQLLEIEELRQSGILSPDTTLAIGLSRVGGADDQQKIVSGTLAELHGQQRDVFGEPLHSLVIVGKRLHPLEAEYAEQYAVNRDNWRDVAQRVYKCTLDA